jgi:hypothetical protein
VAERGQLVRLGGEGPSQVHGGQAEKNEKVWQEFQDALYFAKVTGRCELLAWALQKAGFLPSYFVPRRYTSQPRQRARQHTNVLEAGVPPDQQQQQPQQQQPASGWYNEQAVQVLARNRHLKSRSKAGLPCLEGVCAYIGWACGQTGPDGRRWVRSCGSCCCLCPVFCTGHHQGVCEAALCTAILTAPLACMCRARHGPVSQCPGSL